MPDTVASPTASDSQLALRVLGRAALVRANAADDLPPLLGPGKPLALLTYLSCATGRITREDAIGRLWGDRDDVPARHALRQAIWTLRNDFGDDLILVSGDHIELGVSLPSDRVLFRTAAASQDLESAVTLYQGEFFPGFASPGGEKFESWARTERHALREMFHRLAVALVRRMLADKRPHDALVLARRARDAARDARCEPVTEAEVDTQRDAEHGWRLMIECHADAGDAVSAARAADDLEQWLRSIHREPESKTRSAIRAVRAAPPPHTTVSPRSALVAELVGREREFAAIMAAWDGARGGSPRLLHISGHAGLGKSRLLEDTYARLTLRRACAVYVPAQPGDRDIPFALVAAIALSLAALPGHKGVAPDTAATLLALSPALSSYYHGKADPSSGDDAVRRRAIAIAELIAVVAANQPLAILVDDLHWADAASRQVLNGALGRFAGARVLVVTASRPSSTALATQAQADTIALRPLSPGQVRVLVDRPGALDDEDWAREFATMLHGASDGSPLLILETLQLLIERGTLALDDKGWRCSRQDELSTLLASGSAIGRRLESLNSAEQRMLTLMSVSGTSLSCPILAGLAELTASDAGALLSQLEVRGLAIRHDSAWQPGHDEIAERMLTVATPFEVRKAHGALGRHYAGSEPVTIEMLRRAAPHLVAAGDLVQLDVGFARAFDLARRAGDDRAPAALARDLLGSAATDALERRLARRVFWTGRARRRALATLAAGAAVLAIASASGAFARPTAPPPDVELMLVLEDSAGGRRAEAVGLRAANLEAGPTLDIDRLPSRTLSAAIFGAAALPVSWSRDGRWAISSYNYADSGGIDLVLVGPSGTRRLTRFKGDDGDEFLTADDQFVVFSSRHWDPVDAANEIAVLDLRSGEVRRLTRSRANEGRSAPSPDGSRVVFARRFDDLRPTELCTISFDGSAERCFVVRGETIGDVLAWRTGHEALVNMDSAGKSLVQAINVDRGVVSASVDAPWSAKVSPDGRWMLFQDDQGEWRVVQLDHPDRRVRLMRSQGPLHIVYANWRTMAPSPLIDRLRVIVPKTGVELGSQARLSASATDAAGKPVDIGVLSWATSDTSIATVDSMGLVTPHRPGTVRIVASAGGWRADSVRVTVHAGLARRVMFDDWSAWPSPQWTAYGVPVPTRVRGDNGRWDMAHNGDSDFPSGVYSRFTMSADSGMGVELAAQVPISRTKWQWLDVSVRSSLDSARLAQWDHRSGAVDGGQNLVHGSACNFSMPGGEGFEHVRKYVLSTDANRVLVRIDSTLSTGRWFRMRLQVFPDGRCGLAIDGVPVLISSVPMSLDRLFRVVIQGQSVGTQVLVGPVEVWHGVRNDVDWLRFRGNDIAQHH